MDNSNNESTSSVGNVENQPTSSLPITFFEIYRSATAEQKILHQLISEMENIKSDMALIKKDKVMETLKLPQEIIDQLGIDSPKKRLRRGNGARPLMELEIKEAFEKRITAASAARFLGVSLYIFKRWAKIYNLWDPKPHTKGLKRPRHHEDGKYPLSKILEGKCPDVHSYRIREKLFRSGMKQRKCEQCGFKEKRITDGRQPLLLNFVDNNTKNHNIGNLLILCYNCTFISGRGFIHRGGTGYDLR